jgi:hypothetical protein
MKDLEQAASGFEDWMNESVESEMGRISSRRNTVTIEQELCNKFVWQQAKLSSQKEIARLKEEIEELRNCAVRFFDAEDMGAVRTCRKELLEIIEKHSLDKKDL